MFEIRAQIPELDISPDINKKMGEIAFGMREVFREEVNKSEPQGNAGLYQGKSVRHSAPGQFPAKISGDLYEKIYVVEKKPLHWQVTFASDHAGFVEESRPFLVKTGELAVQRLI